MTQDATITRYLDALETELRGLPSLPREAILDDVRAHVADALESGRDPEAVLAALGTPDAVARDAREQFGVVTGMTPADRAARILHLATVALAVVTAVLVSFVLPSFAMEELSMSSEGTGSTLQTATSLFAQYGVGIALVTLLPAVLALLPLALPVAARRPVAWVNAVVVTVGSVVAGFTIGGFFVPVALLMWAAILVPGWVRRGGSAIGGRIWRTVGAILILIPAVFMLVALATRTVMDAGAPMWIAMILIAAVGVLFGLRLRFIDVTVAVLGVALMVLAVVDAGLLLLAFWWAGGLWLVIGLAAAVGRRAG